MSKQLLQQALDYVSRYIGDGDNQADALHAALLEQLATAVTERVSQAEPESTLNVPIGGLWSARWALAAAAERDKNFTRAYDAINAMIKAAEKSATLSRRSNARQGGVRRVSRNIIGEAEQ